MLFTEIIDQYQTSKISPRVSSWTFIPGLKCSLQL